MKYCLQFAKSSKNKHNTEEISIKYDRQSLELLDFLIEHQEQRIILIVENIADFVVAKEWQKLKTIKENYPSVNIAVCLSKLRAPEEVDTITNEAMNALMEVNIPFFTGDLITTWDELRYFLELNISDIYIAEDLCFDLEEVRKACNKKGVQIRAFPNVAQCSFRAGAPLKKFFVRPEDSEFYTKYIDVFEFWGPLEKQDFYYLIYHTKQRWLGDLKDIIFDLNYSLDTKRIIPIFAQSRANCRRDCMRNGSCRICERLENISHIMKDKEIIIKTKKPH